jgi:hypothetical protein
MEYRDTAQDTREKMDRLADERKKRFAEINARYSNLPKDEPSSSKDEAALSEIKTELSQREIEKAILTGTYGSKTDVVKDSMDAEKEQIPTEISETVPVKPSGDLPKKEIEKPDMVEEGTKAPDKITQLKQEIAEINRREQMNVRTSYDKNQKVIDLENEIRSMPEDKIKPEKPKKQAQPESKQPAEEQSEKNTKERKKNKTKKEKETQGAETAKPKETKTKEEILDGELIDDGKNKANGESVIEGEIIESIPFKKPDVDSEKEMKKSGEVILYSQERENTLKNQLNQARFNYAMKEFNKKSTISVIGKLLDKLKLNVADIDTVKDAYEKYKNCVLEYRDFQISEIKRKAKNGEELNQKLAEVVKYFTCDELNNLFNDYTSAKAESIEKKWGKAPGWIVNKGAKFFNWYRKQDWKKKMAAGIALGMAGGGFAILAARLGLRMVGATAGGIGVANALESRYRKKENEARNARMAEISSEIEFSAAKTEKVRKFLDEDIASYEEKLKTEKKERLKRLGIGVAAGASILALGTLAKKIGVFKVLAEKIGIIDHADVQPSESIVGDGDMLNEEVLEKLKEQGMAPGGTSVPEAPQFESVPPEDIISATPEQPASEVPAEVLSGTTPVPEPSEEITPVPEVGEEVTPVTGEADEAVPAAEPSETAAEAPVESAEVAGTVLEIEKGSSVEGTLIKYLENNPDLIDKYNELNGGRQFNAGQIAHRMTLEFVDRAQEKGIDVDFNDLNYVVPGQEIGVSADGLSLERLSDLSYSKSFSMMKELSFDGEKSWHSNWNDIKNMTLSEAKRKMSPDLLKNFNSLIDKNENIIGKAAKPLRGEPIRKWVARVAELTVQPK